MPAQRTVLYVPRHLNVQRALTDISIIRLHVLLVLSNCRGAHRVLPMEPRVSHASMGFPFSKSFVSPQPQADPKLETLQIP